MAAAVVSKFEVECSRLSGTEIRRMRRLLGLVIVSFPDQASRLCGWMVGEKDKSFQTV